MELEMCVVCCHGEATVVERVACPPGKSVPVVSDCTVSILADFTYRVPDVPNRRSAEA